MRYRLLGNTGIKVSEIGFGAWGIGGKTADGPNSYGLTDDKVSVDALRAALDRGITFYDTSNVYGYGHSEELLREAFKGARDKIIIADKVGSTRHRGPHNLDVRYIREELEKSLKRLGTDYIDLYQLHSPPIQMVKDNPQVVELLRDFQKEGKIRAYGFSIKHPEDGLTAIKDFGFRSIQVNFNLIDQRAADVGLIECAKEHGAGIIARTPFCFGFLTDKITDLNFPNDDHRSMWPKAQLRRWLEAPRLFLSLREGKKWSAAHLALRFCLSFPEVSTVIPGILKPEQAYDNASASDSDLLTAAELARARAIYKNNVFFDPNLKEELKKKGL